MDIQQNNPIGLSSPTVTTETAEEVKTTQINENNKHMTTNKDGAVISGDTKTLTPTHVGTGCSLVYNEEKVRKVMNVIQSKFNHTEVSMLNSLLTRLDRQLVMKEIIDGENAKIDVFNAKSDWKPGYVPKPHIPYPFTPNGKEVS